MDNQNQADAGGQTGAQGQGTPSGSVSYTNLTQPTNTLVVTSCVALLCITNIIHQHCAESLSSLRVLMVSRE